MAGNEIRRLLADDPNTIFRYTPRNDPAEGVNRGDLVVFQPIESPLGHLGPIYTKYLIKQIGVEGEVLSWGKGQGVTTLLDFTPLSPLELLARQAE